jgi:hypothetical protein
MWGWYRLIGNKQLEKIICVACTEPFGDHTKRGLIRCIFRIQGTMVSNGINNESMVVEPVKEIEDQEWCIQMIRLGNNITLIGNVL